MNDFSKHIGSGLDGVHLTPQEKARMRAALSARMAAFPYRGAIPSPYAPRGAFSWFSAHRLMGALASLVIVVLVSGSTAYAAQGALPGNPLYGVKIYVNEPVQEALATTDTAKAQFHAQVATERLKEAEQLAADGELTPSTSAELAANLDEHVSQAAAITQKLQQTDAPAAAQISTELAVALDAHSAVLSSISAGTKGEDADDSSALAAHAHSTGLALADVSVPAASPVRGLRVFKTAATLPPQAQGTASTSGTTTVPSAETTAAVTSAVDAQVAGDMKTRALAAIASARNLYTGRAQLDASSTALIDSRLGDADQAVAKGDTALAQDDVSTALGSYRQALKDGLVLQTALGGSDEFLQKVLVPKKGGNEEGSTDQGRNGGIVPPSQTNGSATDSSTTVSAEASTTIMTTFHTMPRPRGILQVIFPVRDDGN